MESLGCQSVVPVGYLDDATDPALWSYSSSAPMSGGEFNSNTVIASNVYRPLAEYWEEYRPTSPPASDQSSMSRAPSSNTSYNEFDGGESSPEDISPRHPYFNITRYQSPTFHHPDLNPRMDPMGCDPMFDLGAPMASRTPNRSIPSADNFTTPEANTCLEGCLDQTFSRPYDLTRHINRQHRCPHKDCREVKFSTAQERKNHEKKHSEPGLGWRCGTCSLTGTVSKPLSRLEKLKKHFKDTHKIPSDCDFVEYRCTQGSCYLGESCGGIYFTSQRDLAEHTWRNHSTVPANDMARDGRNCRPIYPQPLVETVGVGNVGKRPLEQDLGSETKRWKAKKNETSSSQSMENDSRIDSYVTLLHAPEPGEKSLKLSVVDLQTLSKQQKWKSTLDELSSMHISPTFDCKQSAIKLRGPCSAAELKRGKLLLADLISQSKSMTLQDIDADMSGYSKPRTALPQQVSVHPQPELCALDPKEDADILLLWSTHLLPGFPGIVREASVDGSYSVALVRQNGVTGSHPIVRFRSSGNQSDTSRQIIRESVAKICETNGCLVINVQFTEGTLVRLARGSSVAPVLDDPSNDQKFPHERRPWRTPGMGASIGLSQCPHVSATLGGYISVNGQIYMLSVDHFISECPCVVDTPRLRSPSISDLVNVKIHLEKKLKELGFKITRSAPDEVPLGQIEERLFPFEVNEELEQYKRFRRELNDRDGFALGVVRERCGGGVLPLRPSANPRFPGILHHMDWSLSEITSRQREGKNIHRHSRVARPGLDDLAKEVTRPEGCGVPCSTIGDVAGGEGAYYVGTTSGLREGCVSPALIQYSDEYGNISHEWSLLVPRCETLKDTDFQGDSGAWIIGNNDELLGLLWGWDNGSLLFTPIRDVFADISQKMNCERIELPEHPPGPRSGRSGSLLCRRSILVTRESTPKSFIESDEPEDSDGSDEPGPVTSTLLPPIAIVTCRRRGSSASNISTCSDSSIPSLLSSSSSFSEDSSPQPSPHPDSKFLVNGLPIRTKPRPLSDASEPDWVHIGREEIIKEKSTRSLIPAEIEQQERTEQKMTLG